MRIESVKREDDRVIVQTTGAVFTFQPDSIEVHGRIPEGHDVVGLHVPVASTWIIAKDRPEEVVLQCGALEVKLGHDGFLTLGGATETEVRPELRFDPERIAENEQVRDCRVTSFGVGFYRQKNHGDVRSPLQAVSDERPLYVHVFPPREENEERKRQFIAHEGRPQKGRWFPSDDVIDGAKDHASIFALHAYFWREEDRSLRPKFSRYRFRRCSWTSASHEPESEDELIRVQTRVKEAGMLFVPYVSPRYSAAQDIVSELKRLQARWDFDGFYLDGLRGDFLEQREFLIELRSILGPQKIIYLNGSDQPFGSPRLTAPFLEAHCDYVLRGDSGRDGMDRDEFLAWCVRGTGAGNHVGVWCHYGSSGWPFPFDRVPPLADQKAAARAGVQIWRRSFWWPGAQALSRFDDWQKKLY